jgi:hypothetical protein
MCGGRAARNAPSSIGRESTTYTVKRVPSSHACSNTFSTTDDLDSARVNGGMPMPVRRRDAPCVGEHDITVVDLLRCSLLNDLVRDDDAVADVVVDRLAQRVLCLRTGSAVQASAMMKHRTHVLLGEIDVRLADVELQLPDCAAHRDGHRARGDEVRDLRGEVRREVARKRCALRRRVVLYYLAIQRTGER